MFYVGGDVGHCWSPIYRTSHIAQPSVKTKNSVCSTTTVTPDQKHILPAFSLSFSEKTEDAMSSAVHITGPIIYAQMHIVPYDTPHSCAAIPTVAIHRLQNSSKPFATFSINISAKIIMVVLSFDVLPLYTSGV